MSFTYTGGFRPLTSDQTGNPDGVPVLACPRPADHIPDCLETDYDRRGDCDGDMRFVVLLLNYAGKAVGEEGWMCASHAQQCARRRQVRMFPDSRIAVPR